MHSFWRHHILILNCVWIAATAREEATLVPESTESDVSNNREYQDLHLVSIIILSIQRTSDCNSFFKCLRTSLNVNWITPTLYKTDYSDKCQTTNFIIYYVRDEMRCFTLFARVIAKYMFNYLFKNTYMIA
jgi:hypothetical protein